MTQTHPHRAAGRLRAPPLTLLAMEPLRALLEFTAGRLAPPAPAVGDGHPVIVFPGLGAGSYATAPLRHHLADAGFEPHCWGRGTNTGPDGDFDRWLDGLQADLQARHDAAGQRVSLVGWSLGGIYARELAKRTPDLVRQVITLGTPLVVRRGTTHAERLWGLVNRGPSRPPPAVAARLRRPPPVPVTAIYSRSDGIVAWRSCLEHPTALAENVEVSASHLGLVTHPEVLRVVVERLARG